MGGGSSKPQPVVIEVTAPPKQAPIQEVKAEIRAVEQTVKEETQSFKTYLTNFGEQITNASKSVSSTLTQVCNSSACQAIRKSSEEFREEVQKPICQFYQTLPYRLTEAKFEVIPNYTYNQRFMFINLVCVLTAIVTFKRMPDYGLTQKTLRAFRNSGVVYLVGGLFVTPEIYNPIMKE